MIKLFEAGYEKKSLVEIVKEICKLCDALTFSFRTMFANTGGAVLINRPSSSLSNEEHDELSF
jgi:tryptophanase